MKKWLYEFYESSVPALVAIFGGILMAIGFEVEGAVPSIFWIFLGGLCITHGVETSAVRARAKVEARICGQLMNLFMDERDINVTVTREGEQ
ncbi:hypothetical protein [Nitratireductor basaltis]|uniref:Uncharacterized protein n=1 Tax=Nitratireductor basaltis TaxID=472175 RepID=A0A084UDL5_9HYPH|nr:hypothetical protein [Nitratireductor basaltis]KFB11051.1 hypothetical protein EL18_02093 [Nitratireductor basaltis]